MTRRRRRTRAKAAPTQILVCFVQIQRGRLVVVCLEEFSGSCSRREVMSWNSGPKSVSHSQSSSLSWIRSIVRESRNTKSVGPIPNWTLLFDQSHKVQKQLEMCSVL